MSRRVALFDKSLLHEVGVDQEQVGIGAIAQHQLPQIRPRVVAGRQTEAGELFPQGLMHKRWMSDRMIGNDGHAVLASFPDSAGLACSAADQQHIGILQIFPAAPGGQTELHAICQIEGNHPGTLDQFDEGSGDLDPGHGSDGGARNPNLPGSHARRQVFSPRNLPSKSTKAV